MRRFVLLRQFILRLRSEKMGARDIEKRFERAPIYEERAHLLKARPGAVLDRLPRAVLPDIHCGC